MSSFLNDAFTSPGKTRQGSINFTVLSDEQLKIDLLQIRRLAYRSRVRTRINGPLFQKGRRGAKSGAERVRVSVEDALKLSKWKFPPRARVAVSFAFSSGADPAPALHNLVKCYLDLLKGLAFSDDRQVHYLQASLYSGAAGDGEPKTYVEIERMTDYVRRLDLYLKYAREVEDRVQSKGIFDVSDLIAPYLPVELQQHSLIERSEITAFDQPTNRYRKYLPPDNGLFRLNPLSVELGDLPKDGESSAYEQHVQDSWEAWKLGNGLLIPLLTPVALDVQVTPCAIKLGKDLDNIFRTVSRSLGRQVFGSSGYVSAFRIYVTGKLEGETSGNVRVKFLPRHAIFDFERKVEEVLEKAAEYIEGRLW